MIRNKLDPLYLESVHGDYEVIGSFDSRFQVEKSLLIARNSCHPVRKYVAEKHFNANFVIP